LGPPKNAPRGDASIRVEGDPFALEQRPLPLRAVRMRAALISPFALTARCHGTPSSVSAARRPNRDGVERINYNSVMVLNGETLRYHLINRLKRWAGMRDGDDWDWRRYNIHYRGELKGIEKEHTLNIRGSDFAFEDGELRKKNPAAPDLHPNHRLLYETILQLRPASVLELGCGGGDHLSNLSVLRPQLKLFGRDLLEDQLAFLKERHPSLSADLAQFDCTLPFPIDSPSVDVAYTQAVLMHIQVGNGHRVALANLFRSASKQVVLMEAWTRHDFMGDIRRLHELKIIPWKEIFFHYRESPELRKPHLMVVSSSRLEAYPALADYKALAP
jgi:SAM-dependent methyltransferase